MSTSKIARRDFVKGTAGAAALVAASATGASMALADDATDVMTVEKAEGAKWAFQVPPEPIPDDQIANTVENDVVVIGGGTAGLVAAARLLEQGVGVTLIAQSGIPVGRGGSTFVMGSKLMDEKGVHSDIAKAYKKMMGYHSFLVDQDKWWLHANRSEEAMNWLIDIMTTGSSYGGCDLTPVLEAHYEDPEDIVSEYWGTHDFIGGPNAPTSTRENPQQDVVENLAAYCTSLGGDLRFAVTGKQLVREDGGKGRVTAVIAEEDDGYTKFVGTKAVVLATGDFGANDEMVHAYCPEWVWDIKGGVYEGTGHQMGLWVGAAWQKTKMAAPMLFNFQYVKICNQVRAFQGLLVNKEGKRFSNEDNVLSHAALAALGQTDHESFAIWDTEYAKTGPWGEDYYGGPSVAGENGEAMIAAWDDMVEHSGEPIAMNGASLAMDIYKGDSIEELAEKMGLPVDEVMATVERYNGYCDEGVDEDYGKPAELLMPVRQAPFYAVHIIIDVQVSIGSIATDRSFRALSEAGEPIEGLYVVGVEGAMLWANVYTMNIAGGCNANNVYSGRVAARHALGIA